MSATGILQAATTIAKTVQTAVGAEIGTENAMYITLFFSYVKGNETGLDIILNARNTTGGANHQNRIWTPTSGAEAGDVEKIRVTASGDYFFTWLIKGIDFVQFTAGGSNNDGTPTGTLAASYTLTGV
jgi:hypothetical protein